MTKLLRNTIKKADLNKELKAYKTKGYFLNSAISVLEPDSRDVSDWILTYYSAKKNKVVQLLTQDQGFKLKQPATPLQPTKQALDIKAVKTKSAQMIKKAMKEFKKQNIPLSQIIISLQNEIPHTWRINFVTKTLQVFIVRINAENGKILDKNLKNLTHIA